MVTDASDNDSNVLTMTEFTIDATAPVITQVTPITTPTTDTTPDYTFTTDEAGDITYGGFCSALTTEALVGTNTITLNILPVGTYVDCTITITDALGNISSTLTILSFTIFEERRSSGSGTSIPVRINYLNQTGQEAQAQQLIQNYSQFINSSGGLPLGSGLCESSRILSNSMKKGDRNGNYSTYNRGTITQIGILQAHINRILASRYNQAAGPIDGIFGPLTEQGVKRLQTALNEVLKPNPLLKIDGIVGSFTRGAVNNSCGL